MATRRGKRWIPVLWFALGYAAHSLFSKSFTSHPSSESLTSNTPILSQFLVVFVLSRVKNYDRRQVIRETWASNLDKDTLLYFVISGRSLTNEESNSLAQESKSFNDLLILHEVEESFDKLTYKLLAALLWVTGDSSQLNSAGNATLKKPFKSFSFLLKCDDDSFVQVSSLLSELKTKYINDSMLYWGFFDGRAKVKKAGKYKEMGWNLCDTYLPYALGGGYVLAHNPVQFIARNAQYWRRYQSEDTSVGAWLANLEGLSRQHDPRFDTEYISRGCHQSYLITHKQSAEAMRRIHKQLSEHGLLCSKEYRTRLSYRYNWNVLPSKCCQRNNPSIP